MENRGKITTSRIAEKLRIAKSEVKLTPQNSDCSNNPLLFINGRLNRKDNLYIPKNLSLLQGIENNIKKYCKGVDLTIINYLLHRGIQSVKSEGKFLSLEYADIENLYKHNKKMD